MPPRLQITATILVDGRPELAQNPGRGRGSILSKLRAAGAAEVESVRTGCSSQQPPRPYTTSRLQQDASRLLGFTCQQTMQLAQSLFEGLSPSRCLRAPWIHVGR